MSDIYSWIYQAGIDKNVRAHPGAFEEFTCAGCGGTFYKKTGRPHATCSPFCSRINHEQKKRAAYANARTSGKVAAYERRRYQENPELYRARARENYHRRTREGGAKRLTTLWLEPDLIDALDSLVAQGIHPNRSEAIRTIVRTSLDAVTGGDVAREEEVAP